MHRRQHGRVRTVGLTTHLYTGGRLASSLPVENLSLGGAFLRTLMPLKAGTAIGLQFFCPGRPQPLAVAAKVATVLRSESRGSTGVGLGVAFDPLTPDQEQWMRKLLLAHAPGPALLEGDVPLNPPAPPSPPAPPPRFLDEDLPEPATSYPWPAPSTTAPYGVPASMPLPAPSKAAAAPGAPAPAASSGPAPSLAARPVPGSQAAAPASPHPPPAARAARQAPELIPEVGKLMVQVKGLLMQISDWQEKADALEKQNRSLQAENERLKAAVAALTTGRVA